MVSSPIMTPDNKLEIGRGLQNFIGDSKDVIAGASGTRLVEAWVDDDIGQPITVVLGIVENQPNPAGMTRLFATINFGSHGFQSRVLVDVRRQTSIVIPASYVNVEATLLANAGESIRVGAYATLLGDNVSPKASTFSADTVSLVVGPPAGEYRFQPQVPSVLTSGNNHIRQLPPYARSFTLWPSLATNQFDVNIVGPGGVIVGIKTALTPADLPATFDIPAGARGVHIINSGILAASPHVVFNIEI